MPRRGRRSASGKPESAGATARDPNESAAEGAAIQLYLLRHADAGDPMTWSGDDAARPLSAKGRRQARRLGRLLAAVGWKPDLLLTSPKVRAAQTAQLVGKAIDVEPEEEPRLGTGFDLGVIRALLREHPDRRRIVLVGHDPDFSAAASRLVGAALELRKGAIARIDLEVASPTAGKGALRWLIPPGVVPD